MKLPGKSPLFLALGLLFCASAHAQTAPPQPLRTLIISGGPSFDSNQYAIESNARYLEKLTQNSHWRRTHFADGKTGSRTVAVTQTSPEFRAERALAWILEEDAPDEPIAAQASMLGRIDGSATKPAVVDALTAFARPEPGELGFLYFTGHGSAGAKPGFLGRGARPDYENTTYALWEDDDISAREVARSLRSWPAKNPLFVVMVQCHSGGFANLMFEDGDPRKKTLDRDIAGFFSTTGERLAAGCTSEVNERDYQDFTTHFFAALSGVSRDGRKVTGADYDRNGAVSGSEAFAWASVHDLSIDVPVSTSDMYLRAVLPRQADDWQTTPYSTVLRGAQPWQKAMLNELSSALKLKGETRIADAIRADAALHRRMENDDEDIAIPGVDMKAMFARVDRLRSELAKRFPDLSAPDTTTNYANARRGALRWLMARPAEINALDGALIAYGNAQNGAQTREAMLERFVRGAYTVILQNRLRKEGTPAQMAFFTKLRMAENRNPLR